jgi:hypothetical protein
VIARLALLALVGLAGCDGLQNRGPRYECHRGEHQHSTQVGPGELFECPLEAGGFFTCPTGDCDLYALDELGWRGPARVARAYHMFPGLKPVGAGQPDHRLTRRFTMKRISRILSTLLLLSLAPLALLQAGCPPKTCTTDEDPDAGPETWRPRTVGREKLDNYAPPLESASPQQAEHPVNVSP